MIVCEDPQFISFLLRAKQNTYAASDADDAAAQQVVASRPESHDLAYQEGEWSYLDTYLGGLAFAGEEAVWKDGRPVWAMNYYGSMTGDSDAMEVPEGFGTFLKHALMEVPAEAPYRGPALFNEGHYTYTCHWSGGPARFTGEETIALDGQTIYLLHFHGGIIL